jgi:hypothetical protein
MHLEQKGIDTSISASRRTLLGVAGRVAAAATIAPAVLASKGWLIDDTMAQDRLTRNAMEGLVAFVVPGPDDSSVAQGVFTEEPGGIDAGIVDTLISTFDVLLPPPRPFRSLSTAIASVLNSVALIIGSAQFEQLSFVDKARVLERIEAESAISDLVEIVTVVSLLAYSEAGVFDRETRTLTGKPIGWTIADFAGMAEGHNDFRGYYEGTEPVD